eukprot:115084_1
MGTCRHCGAKDDSEDWRKKDMLNGEVPIHYINGDFKVHIAIDFGTDGCGLAFALKGEDDITVYNKWNRKKKNIMVKTKTQILLNEQNKVVAFGNDAKKTFITLSGDENKEYKLFERFKMALYDSNLDDNKMETDISDELISANGKTCPSEIVFIAAFKFLDKECKKHLKKILQKRKINKKINDDEIQ